jgi:hypothetical protein
LDQARVDATKRLEERTKWKEDLVKERELNRQKIDKEFKRTLLDNNKILADKDAMRKMAMDFAKAKGGGISGAAILSQGIQFDALGPQFIQFVIDKLDPLKQFITNTGVGIVNGENLNQFIKDKIDQDVAEGKSIDSVLLEISTEIYNQAVKTGLSIGQVIGIKYDLARMISITGVNAIELGGYSYNNQALQDYAQTSRDYLTMLPTSGEINSMFAKGLGVDKENVKVDLNQVVSETIFQKYLNPFSAKSNSEIATQVLDSISWGDEDPGVIRENAHQAITSILGIIERSL